MDELIKKCYFINKVKKYLILNGCLFDFFDKILECDVGEEVKDLIVSIVI